MQTTESQNALLKLLEDPPSHVYFFLCTTDPDKLIKTIRNRCSVFEVKSLRRVEIQALLREILQKEKIEDFPELAIEKISEVCEGSPRKALVILDKVVDILNADELLKAIQEAEFDESSAIELCRSLLQNNWGQVSTILINLEEDPEKVRRAVLGYMGKVLLGKQVNVRASYIINFFSDSFFMGGKPLLVNACFKACQ